ncbi:MAG: hypothetical protein JRE70_15840 [Deltaproteobacteria bacterium]|nr:hypothetical protein [Deltaproteobacteria bacterium]
MRFDTHPTLAWLTCLGVLLAPPAMAEPTAWDQATVTALAEQLASSAGDLRNSVRRAPPLPGLTQRRARAQVLDDLRVAENSINSLARRLAAGAGREDTYPTFRRIRTLRNDIARQVQRAHITEPTISKLEAARELLDQLMPFYAPGEVD